MTMSEQVPHNAIHEAFWRDGYVILRQLFTPDEVAGFRRSALERGRRKADLLSDKDLSEILLDSRVLDAFRAILGAGELVYFGDSSTMIGETAAGFHKDNPDKHDAAAPDWQVDRYPIVRMGIYTADHSLYPDGVDLRQGSHNTVSLTHGRHVQPDTRVGDVVFWNLRTSHSGGAMKFRGRPVDPESLAGKVLRRLPALRDKPIGERVAIFASMGRAGPQLDRFIEALKRREYALEGWAASHWSPAVRERAAAAGLTLREPGEEVKSEPPRRVTREHVPLPY